MQRNPEYRLKAGSGQDRSVNLQYARTTDKGNQNGWRYSLLSHYNFNEMRVNTQDKVYGAGACLNPSAGRILFAHEFIA